MPLIPAVRVNDFSYKGIVEGFKPNQAAQVYHNQSECSTVKWGHDLMPYNPDMPGERLQLCFHCERLAEQENAGSQ
jgi:hypothetical protein